MGVIVLPESHQPDFFLAEGWEADFDALRPQIEGLADALTRADTARVTSALGTDVRMSIAGRRGRALHGFANTTDISAGYCLESSLAPVEGTAEGIIVVNASIPGVSLIRDEPVRIRLEKAWPSPSRAVRWRAGSATCSPVSMTRSCTTWASWAWA